MIRYFFGVPGSGKTTVAVKLLYKEFKKMNSKNKYKQKSSAFHLYSNIGDTISKPIDIRNLKHFKPPENSLLMIDESGIEFNSRDFKSFDKGYIEYFKKHRHNYDNICFFSQSMDTDKIIRDLAVEWWSVSKIGPLTVCRRYFFYIVPPSEHTNYFPVYGLKTRSPLWQLLPFQPKQFMFVWRPRYYKYFDSFSPIDRPMREDLSIYEEPLKVDSFKKNKYHSKTVSVQLD